MLSRVLKKIGWKPQAKIEAGAPLRLEDLHMEESPSKNVMHLSAEVMELVELARPLVERWELRDDSVSEQYARADVYSRLIKLAPLAARLDISLAIEKAIRDFRGIP